MDNVRNVEELIRSVKITNADEAATSHLDNVQNEVQAIRKRIILEKNELAGLKTDFRSIILNSYTKASKVQLEIKNKDKDDDDDNSSVTTFVGLKKLTIGLPEIDDK